LGFNGSPLAEGERLWFTTLVGDVHCLDIAPLLRSGRTPTSIWKVDLVEEFGVFPHYPYMADGKTCSISSSYKGRIYVITGHGTGGAGGQPSARAPSLICFDKDTGKDIWEDNSPGGNILRGQCGSPLVIEINRRAQVITPQGDGWVRSFDAMTGELIWKLDINPKNATRDNRNPFMAAPVFHENRIYIGGGQSMEEGSGPGRLFCIDATKKGDLSLELEDGPGKGKSNPNSGVVWSLAEFNRTQSLVAIHAGLLIAADFPGNIYCLDARTGQKFWRHESKAEVFGSPLIVDNKVYLANQDGEIFIFVLSKEKQLLGQSHMFAQGAFASPIYSSPVFANGVLYIANQEMLYAIQQK
jgi:outer membrane protein assembly factor BamB